MSFSHDLTSAIFFLAPLLPSVFPTPAMGKIVILKSDMSIVDAVRTLSDHHILSAPVQDVNAPADAGWVDKYIGIFDMSGAVYHMLETLKSDSGDDFINDASKIEAFQKTQIKDTVAFANFGT